MKVRQARMGDAPEISAFLQELVALGKRTSQSNQAFVRANYIEHRDNIQCTVAEDEDGRILGFQILKIASEGNVFGVSPGWGIIGTHVRPEAARRGVGKTLFATTHKVAKKVGISKIDATISSSNADGLAYYDAIGFRTYRTPTDKVCKYYEISR